MTESSNKGLSKNERIKQRTLEIYDSMPQEKELRKKCFKERDEIISLNYAFFGYIASHTFINNSSISYEDKLQSALMHFCECFWWYKWKGDETHKGYRQDLSFTVFFKPRIGEMIERELNEVKYSVRRSLCMEVGAQIGKHWGQVKYEDLSDPRLKLPADKMNALKAMFGTLYSADLSEHEVFLESDLDLSSNEFENPSDKYNTIEELLIHDMIVTESKLSDSELRHMAEMYQLSYYDLKAALPRAEQVLYKRIKERIDIQDGFR